MDPDGDLIYQWDRLHDWIYCVCVVTFDLELGQAMEVVLVYLFSVVASTIICI